MTGPVVTGRVLGAEAVITRLETTAPATAVTRLRKTIRRLGLSLERKVKLEKLGGQVLNKRSGRLVRSVNTQFTDSEYSSTSRTGTALSYGRFWELGFHGIVTVPAHVRERNQGNTWYRYKRKAATRAERRMWDASGVGISQGITIVRAHTRRVDQAPRPWLRPALEEMRPQIRADLASAMRGL